MTVTDTWGRRLFTAGGAWLLLTAAVHSLSFLNKQTAANETERQLLDLMANYKFNVLGSLRSMNNFMIGFSISFMLAALVLGVLALVLRGQPSSLLKRAALVYVLWLAVMSAVSLHFFFIIPSTFLIVGLFVFALAWFKLPSQSPPIG